MVDPLVLADILLVEDCPADIELIRYVFEKAGICNDLRVISDGLEALDCLMSVGAYEKKEPPDIVFLDLNLPGIGGMEILRRVQKAIPIVILTGSADDEALALQSGARAKTFLSKPMTEKSLFGMVKTLKNLYWGLLTHKENVRSIASLT